jgi:hypothetical protein
MTKIGSVNPTAYAHDEGAYSIGVIAVGGGGAAITIGNGRKR